MSDSKDETDADLAKFEDLCRELNMDKETESISWKKYKEVSQRFSLVGEPLHWFCCALYAACRQSYTPTVGGSNAVVMGNCVSLNKLLRCCNISIYDFISKIKNWCEMANLSSDFPRQIDRLERTFSITLNLFKRYNIVFEQIFLSPRNEKKNTKYRSVTKCSSNKLYDMCWCLYLCAKNEDSNCIADLVTSFHLLLCCIDLIYKNVLAENRIDLINPEFEGLPDKWNSSDFNINSVTNHCIIAPLCRLTDALSDEAKNMKENSWKHIIEKFFQTNTIYGNADTFLGIISNANFEKSLKSLNASYEQYILSVGEFDERILLSNPNYRKVNSIDSIEGKSEHHQDIKSFIPDTPYTRKNALPSKETVSEPLANATNSIKKLQDISHITEPTEFIRKYGEDVIKKITDKLNQMAEEFHIKYPYKSEAPKRFVLAKSLYFYLFEKIIQAEVRTKPKMDLNVLLNADTFNPSLIACCVEIVINAYSSEQLKFPWILNCFNIEAFHFCKIIEIVVLRHDNLLTRALIKHLNYIEETCLESLAWKKSSPLWEIIKSITTNRLPLPTWSEVDVSNISVRQEPQVQSPMNSAYETFGTSAVSDSARRDLFNIAKDSALNKKPADNIKKAGSLRIFLRKFYKLTWLRIKELCTDLDLLDDSLNKIWTLFEYSITQTELMQDRHADQILMCAIYVYIRLGEIPGKTFTEIMKFYRKQPQATSSTYREMLLESADKKGDIICFYNNVYVQKMTPYALAFSEKKKSRNDLQLSPHPSERQIFPRKPSSNTALYVYPMEKNDKSHSPHTHIYEFCRSPAKKLENINAIVRGKRNLPFHDDKTGINSKLMKVMEDRKEKRS